MRPHDGICGLLWQAALTEPAQLSLAHRECANNEAEWPGLPPA